MRNSAQSQSLAPIGGGTKLSRVQNDRLAGILTDGRLRDFAELQQYDLAIYCRGEATRWGGDVVTPYEANRSVVLAGVGIHPGDYIFADPSGAVAIPANEVRPFFKARARSPWRTRNPSRPSETKRHPRRPGTLNTDPLGCGVDARRE